jgi:hypothetical protein
LREPGRAVTVPQGARIIGIDCATDAKKVGLAL